MAYPTKRANASNEGGGASNTFANILTVTQYGSDVLLAHISVQDSNHGNLPVTAVKWGGASGQAFTKIGHIESTDNVRSELWILLNPDAGLKDLYVACTGSVWKGVVLSHWSGAKQTTTLQYATATGSGSTPSVDLGTNTSEAVVVDAVSAEAGFSAYGSGQTALGNDQGQSFENVIASYEQAASPSTVTMSETLTSGQPWAIIAAQLEPVVDNSPARKKTFLYKLYSSTGTFKKVWSDVISEPQFASVMNEGFSEMVVEVARNTVSYGEDSDVKYGNQIKVYSFDRTDGTSGGTLIFSGRLTHYVPALKGREETLKITFLSFWQQAQQILVEDDNANYTLTPSSIFKEDNIVPEMEANTTPAAHTASASTELSGYSAYSAFDRNYQTKWTTNSVTTGWLKFDFGIFMAPVIKKYCLTAPKDSATECPKTWKFQGSNDNSAWTDLDTQTNVTSWSAGERKSFEITNSTAYRYYRIDVTANNGHANYLSVASFEMYEAYARSGATAIRYKAQDPSNILKDLLDRFTQSSVGGKLDYSTGTVDATSTSVDYLFESVTYQEAFKKIVELCPVGWYLRVGADDIVYLKNKSSTADHNFVLGKHIAEFIPEKRIENIINTIYFYGGDPGTGNRLFKKYTRSSSISSYGVVAVRISDEKVLDTATMDIIAGRILDNFDSPEIRIVLKVIDDNNEQSMGYDIESIKVGQTCKIFNATSQAENKWDQSTWDTSKWDFDITNAAATLLQIQRVEYHPDYAILELSNRQPDIARRIEEINKRLIEQQVKDNPIIPS